MIKFVQSLVSSIHCTVKIASVLVIPSPQQSGLMYNECWLEMSEHLIDISNLVSPLASLVNDFENIVTVGGNDTFHTGANVSHGRASSLITNIYPEINMIDNISELDGVVVLGVKGQRMGFATFL